MLNSQKINKIAVLRALQLGDLLCAVPALRALRQRFPQSEISLIGLPWSKEFVQRFHMYVDHFIEFPGFPSLPEREPDMNMFPEFIRQCREKHFDLVIQMHGNGIILNALLPLLNSRLTAGFFKNEIFAPENDTFMSWPEQGHEIHRLLKLMEFLGIPSQGDALEFPVCQNDTDTLNHIFTREKISFNRFVCVHPGAQVPARRWSHERFAAVADRIYRKGYNIVFTGSAHERALISKISSLMRYPSYNLAGKTSLGSLAVLLSRSSLLIGNDTGVSHIAAAMKTPSVIIVTGSDPERWRPLDQYLHQALFTSIDCRPCAYQICPFKQPCSLSITVDKVLRCADKFLENIPKRKGIKCAH
ncbi:MAG: glycosyltransferase family 9 protein [Candidatus Omnitrophota bacterium]